MKRILASGLLALALAASPAAQPAAWAQRTNAVSRLDGVLQFLGSFTLAQLTNGTTEPASTHPSSLAWCADCRVGSQAAGAGTGALVISSGGNWLLPDGIAPVN